MTTSNSLRIVSLLPSATETVAALGLTDCLVGRSHECDYPPEIQSLPVCTEARLNSQKNSAGINEDVQALMQSALSIYEIKTDVLEELQPTHIITQDQCDACAVSISQVQQATAQLISSQPEIISLRGNVLTEVWVDMKHVAERLGVDSQQALSDLQSRVDACTRITDEIAVNDRPRVATIEWIDPLMSGGNWLPELIKIAGGTPVLDETGARSRYVDWQELHNANPDVIVIMPCGFDLDRTRQEAQMLTQRSDWSQLKAVQENRVYIVDGNAYFNRPGPRLVDSIEILAEILDPQQFPYGYEGKAWEQLKMPASV
jgi:iron complex transport system substrate-binding protein